MRDTYYVVYNPHIDEFIRVRKLSDIELGDALVGVGKLIRKKGVKISAYIRQVVREVIVDGPKYNLDEHLESLFECVIEVYPLFQIDMACKAVNEITEIDSEPEVLPKRPTLSQLNRLRGRIAKRLVGQDSAIDECLKSIKLIESGLDKFISLFFIGPTGVGKTELARLLADEYLGSPEKLLKINCAEYQNGHEYAKLIGSPPGYVGHNEKGILSEKASESSKWIICFDEIEKAHPRFMNLLLGLLEDGSLMDSHGTMLDFSDSIILFTSNIGIQEHVGLTPLGFEAGTTTYEGKRSEITESFKKQFSPEFINRLDGTVYFNTLSKADAAKIARMQLKSLPIKITPKIISFVVDGGFSAEYGARQIKRFIRNRITVHIADKVLAGDSDGPFDVSITAKNDLLLTDVSANI